MRNHNNGVDPRSLRALRELRGKARQNGEVLGASSGSNDNSSGMDPDNIVQALRSLGSTMPEELDAAALKKKKKKKKKKKSRWSNNSNSDDCFVDSD
ncbi:hypothetical protein KUV80_13940 [Fictibacillus nanhaiensis]|uniref:hypothetical protein n=1 Tax=Fictibacillus nanhaiensis TaxID=742169 RepID=UPI001C97CB0A|nr:hypothetical protein [Fictibacillus nanhaiensis]MBY6037768.1 hypothetical protein [Fictibacillus nanhaiensis]